MFLFKDESNTHFECPSCGQRGLVPSDVLAETLKETEYVRISCTRCATKFEPTAKPLETATHEAEEKPEQEIGSLPVWLSAPERAKPETEVSQEVELEVASEPEAPETVEPEGQPEPEIELEIEVEPEPEIEPEPEPKIEPEPEPEPEIEPEIEPETEPEIELEIEPIPEPAPAMAPSGGASNKLQFLAVSLAAVLFFLGGILLLASR